MPTNYQQEILIFTDGACSGNPGPGGWGAIIYIPSGQVTELGKSQNPTTNNQMELRAVIEALKFVSASKQKVNVFTDSTYVIRGITKWVFGWKKNNWKNIEGKSVLNQELWEELLFYVQKVSKLNSLNWHYVRGHQGIPGNERCDEIAVNFSQGTKPYLFDGTINEYSYDLFQVPEDTSLPPVNFKKPTQAQYYLSYADGVLVKHATWSECEMRVKGRSGAKFKKITSESEALDTLKKWGLDLNLLEN